mgnify:CR=1 FL=1
MIARFLEDVEIKDDKNGFSMSIYKGEILEAIDRNTHYELRKKNGWGTMAPKECEGKIYEILEGDMFEN